MYDTFKEFVEEFNLGKQDLILTNQSLYQTFLEPLSLKATIVFREKFGAGEPTDEMIDKINVELSKHDFNRIIAFGGGTIMDIAKLFALKMPDKSIELFEQTIPIERIKKLILVPTTCGTGSEVTNISIAELKSKKTKKGLAVDQLYADAAVLIPETMKDLPF